jgi:hypothetical protein
VRRPAWLPRARAAALALALLAGPAALPAQAHRLAPSFLELREGEGGRVDVTWKTPRQAARGAAPEPRLPDPAHCTAAGPRRAEVSPDALVVRQALRCAGGLAGLRVGVRGLAASGTDALVHVVRADGTLRRRVLTSAEPVWRIPERARASVMLRDMAGMGIRHLAGGVDHLLFLLGLVALVRGRRLWIAVSAFTAGHAVTLGLATAGALALPTEPVEIGIAASLVLLGLELARGGRGALGRHPALAPLAFGLLHGLGFAGALREAGVGAGDVPLALAGFHAGLEVAQAVAVAFFLAGAAALGPLARRAPALAAAPATVLGAVGCWLVLARLAAWVGLPAQGPLAGVV